MKFIRRLLPLVWLLGLGVLVVSFIGAARVLNSDPGPSAAGADPSADPPPLSGGLVCFGHADVEGGILPLWPPTFPQPATVRKVLPAAKEGAKVKAGEVLAEFEDDLARFQVREAETALAQAEAKLAEAEKQAERGKKTHAQLIALQQIAVEGKEAELASKQQLLQHLLEIEKVFSGRGEKYNPHEIAAAREGVNALKKAAEAERKKLEQLKQNEPDTEAALAQVRAAVERQKVLLEKARYGLSLTKLTAPSDGVILRSLVREGLQ
ncbi:MAG TPA: hypothetical protein VIL46_07650, partial [Gemmataceae bacterium]